MPEMDGIETTKQLREQGYTQPIVALTANAIAGQADIFFQNGFDDFISKPINIYQLDEILNRHILDKKAVKLVFVADFNDEGLNIIASALETDYQVMTMLTTDKMFTLLEKKIPDIILLGTEMPGKAGYDVVDRLKSNEKWHNIPVVFVEKPIESSKLPGLVRDNIK
jgi:CheY-like chemotaxis protein